MRIISPTGKNIFFNTKRVVTDIQPVPPIPENHYKYFKFVIDDTFDTIASQTSYSQGYTQLSEFELYENSTKIPLTAILDCGSNRQPADSKKEFLVDGSTSGKWCVTQGANYHAWVIFEANDFYEVTKYRMATADDSDEWYGRNPVSWSLYASNTATTEEGDWILIDKHVNDRTIIPSDYRYFTFYKELDIPAEYTRLKAVNMNYCYIDTGVKPETTDSIICVCKDYGITTGNFPQNSYNVIFGSRTGSWSTDCLFMFTRFNSSRYINYARCGTESNITSTPNDIITYQIDNVNNYYKLWIINNSTDAIVSRYTKSGTSTACSWNMWVGCGNNSNNVDVYCNADFYSFKIYNENGVLKVNLVPVRRNSDNVCGFYDLAQKVFRTNLGAGTITGIDF